MTAIESQNLKFTVISPSVSSSRINSEDFLLQRKTLFVPLVFGFLTLTTALPMKESDFSAVSQPMTICQTNDLARSYSNEDIFNGFIKKIVIDSKEMDPEIAEIINKGYRDLLW